MRLMEVDKLKVYTDEHYDRVEDKNEAVVEEEEGGDESVEEDNEGGEGGEGDVDGVVKDILDDDEDNSFEILVGYFVFHRHLLDIAELKIWVDKVMMVTLSEIAGLWTAMRYYLMIQNLLKYYVD